LSFVLVRVLVLRLIDHRVRGLFSFLFLVVSILDIFRHFGGVETGYSWYLRDLIHFLY
jgi:hypothetical protein